MSRVEMWIAEKKRVAALRKERNSIIEKLARNEEYSVSDVAFIMNLDKGTVSRIIRFGRNTSKLVPSS